MNRAISCSTGVSIEKVRLFLCRLRVEHLGAYACICGDPKIMRYLSGTMTREQAEEQMTGFVCRREERGFGL